MRKRYMPVNEAHRPHLEFMRMLSRDVQGREVLVGLNSDETEWYFAHLEDELGPDRARRRKTAAQRTADRDRYLELHDRHEVARIQIVLAEIEQRYNTQN
jgi:hypothetical protein